MPASHHYSGSCSCNSVQIEIVLPELILDYTPRACDCDFCTSRSIEYISDPKGALSIRSQLPLLTRQQGSNQAVFLTCSKCHDVIAASYQENNAILASLNANLLERRSELRPSLSVSPKKMDGKDKVSRWKTIWMPLRITRVE